MFLTGIQPTGEIHLGNYFGAIRPALRMHPPGIFCLADYHALTAHAEPDLLRERVKKLAAALVALGASKGHLLYRQSDLPEVQELSWIIACHLNDGILRRNHAVKASKEKEEPIGIGMFMYPILMSADILLFQASHVPVGKDQLQHLEIAQTAAKVLNVRSLQTLEQEVVKVPEAFISENVGTIPGLDGQKMSKSKNNTIPVFIEPSELKKLVSKIKTDSTPMDQPMNPEPCTIFQLYRQLASLGEIEQMRDNYQSPVYGYGHAKRDLCLALEREFASTRERYYQLLEDEEQVEDALKTGVKFLRPIARQTLKEVRKAVGLR